MDYAADTNNTIIVTQSYADQFGKKYFAGFSYYAIVSQPKITVAGIIPDIGLNLLMISKGH